MKAATLTHVKRLALLLLALGLMGMATSFFLFFSAQLKVSRQTAIATSSEAFLSALKDVETSYRGYVITGAESYLEPYRQSSDDVRQRLQRIEAALADDAQQTTAATRLAALASGVTAFADDVIAARQRAVESARILVRGGKGKVLMDEARAIVTQLVGDTQARARVAERQVTGATWLGVLALLLTALGGVLLWIANRVTARNVDRAKAAMRDLVAQAPIGVALADGGGTIMLHNEAFAVLTQRTQGGLSGRKMQTILPAISPRTTVAQTFELQTGQGDDQRFLNAVQFPVPVDDDGRGLGLILVDMTQERQWALQLELAKSEAEAANRAKSAFIANMSHELRTPLTAVLGYCELIEDELVAENHAVLPDLRKIMVNARHLLALISDILDLSKIEARRLEITPVRFALAKLMQEVEQGSASLALANQNTLAFQPVRSGLVMDTDELRVKQVLLNLISNAAKFTRNGTITVSTEDVLLHDVPHVRLIVRDSGIGMTPEQLEKLFTRFRQADETTTRRFGGTGLGLALTQELVQAMGGAITVESKANAGSVFTVTLPVTYRPPAALSEVQMEEVHQSPSHATDYAASTPPILIVDDQPAQRDVLSRILKKEGYAVATAASGEEALNFLGKTKPGAVLLDVRMPGMDGWQVLKSIRANPQTASIPVIVQTVLDERRFAFALGASAYLKKPVLRQDLAAVLPVVTADSARPAVLLVGAGEAMADIEKDLVAGGWRVDVAPDIAAAKTLLAPEAYRAVLVDGTTDADREPAGLPDVEDLQRRAGAIVLLLTDDGIVAASENAVVHPADGEDDMIAQLRAYLPQAQASAAPQKER
jgi:signal transduction histidine kinase/ActR/RegA family two-component response regulator